MMPIVFCASLAPWPRLYAAADISCSLRKCRSTRDGAVPRQTQKIRTMKMKPSTKPMPGASTMKMSVLVQPAGMIAARPALAIAAPA